MSLVVGRFGFLAPRMVQAARVNYYSAARRVAVSTSEDLVLKYVTSYNRPQGIAELYAFVDSKADVEALLHVVRDDQGNIGYDLTKETSREMSIAFDGSIVKTFPENSGNTECKSRWMHMIPA
jgi:hypothetical protein